MKGEVDAMIVGKQSILFEENVYIEETACVAGQKESEGPLGKLFDVVVEDAMAGMENWEELIDYAMRSGAPLEVIENLQEMEDEGEIYESIEDIWPDYPSKEDFFFNEEEY